MERNEPPRWMQDKHFNEVLFCEDFLAAYPMVCVSGGFFTADGRGHTAGFMSANAKSSIPSIPSIPDRWADGMDDFQFSCEGAEKKRVFSGAMRTGKKFAWKRNHFTKPRCLEPCTSFTDGRAPARFGEKAHSSEKSMSCTCEECIECRISNGFGRDRTFHQTAKPICKSVHQLRCFHIKNSGRIL